MKHLRRSPWSREIARGLILLFMWPSLLISMGSKPAQAQAKLKTIAVMDFENLVGRQGAALGRKAADAVCLQLPGDTYEVLPRDQVLKTIDTLNLTPPLDMPALAKLASGLKDVGLTEIFTGRVIKADVRRGTPSQAHVRVELRVLDADSGEFTNGAVGDGVSSPRYEQVNSDVLIDEAIGKAAFQAITTLRAQSIPRGTVLINKAGEIVLNIGAQDGVRAGMEMIVLRAGMKVARILVTSVTNRDSIAVVKQETRGVMPEDEVKAVYSTAVVGGGRVASTTALSKHRKGLSVAKILSILAGIALLLMVGKMLRDKHPRNVGATDVRAVAALDGTSQPAVHISWGRPATPSGLDLLGFIVYRSTTQYGNYTPVEQVVGPNESQCYDTGTDRELEYVTGGTSDSGGGGSDLDTEETSVTGVRPGTTYYYRVARIIVESSTSGSGGSGTSGSSDVEFNVVVTDFSAPTAGATPVNRPQVMTPGANENISPASQTFQWLSVAGGDLYRIQVSDTPTFDATRTWNSPDEDAHMALPGGGDNQTMTATFNLSSRFPTKNATTGQSQQWTLFWRVGARHRTDGVAPEPDGFIFSDAVRVQTTEMPPDAP